MTNNKPTDEKLKTMLSETQAQITERHAKCIRGGSVEVDAYLFENMLMELQRSRQDISFYRDGIVAAAAWVDTQREAYDNEHGRHDPDTGSFEFGNDLQRDYSTTLAEIADGIRALHPNADKDAQTLTEAERQELQEYRKAQKPVSFDALRDAVAEMSGGRAMEWRDIHKGHQPVPFINFNSLSRIVEKFRAAPQTRQ